MTAEVRAFLADLDRLELRLSRLEDRAARQFARLLQDMERELVTALQRGTVGAWNAQRARALFNEINRIAENGLLTQADWLTTEIPELGAVAGEMAVAGLELSGFSAETIRDSWAAWEKGGAYEQLLGSGHQHWWNEIVSRNEDYRQALQQELTRGMTLGLDSKAMAERLIESTSKLNVQMGNPQVWAERIVRTESTRINNDMSIAFAQETGVELFYNFGIPDDRQAEECAEASAAEPMTLDEMAARFDLPPRHPNCRCKLMPWNDDWGLDFGDLKPEKEEAVA